VNGKSYAILRSGILDHLLAGRLGFFELGLYTAIHLQADFKSGIWIGSAPRLLACAPRGASLRRVQAGLDTLHKIRFVRPFHVRGKRGNYVVLIDKYDVRTGAQRGKRLNAWKSASWESPCYEVRTETDADGFTDACAEDAPYQESVVKSQEESKAKGAPETGAPVAQAAPRPSPSFAFAGSHLRITERQDRILGEAFPWVARPAEYRKADSWLEAHPDRRPKNHAKFAHNWFAKIPAPSSANGGRHGPSVGNRKSPGAVAAGPSKYAGLEPHATAAE
jgi:hypothetical protein